MFVRVPSEKLAEVGIDLHAAPGKQVLPFGISGGMCWRIQRVLNSTLTICLPALLEFARLAAMYRAGYDGISDGCRRINCLQFHPPPIWPRLTAKPKSLPLCWHLLARLIFTIDRNHITVSRRDIHVRAFQRPTA